MRNYIAHISEDKVREQSVRDHLKGTAVLARDFADVFGYGDWGYCAGMLHDIGKYSEGFQGRIRGGLKKVDHSTAGAQLCHKQGGPYTLLSYCIAGHHAGLPDSGAKSDPPDAGTIQGRWKRRVEDYQAYQSEVEIPQIEQAPMIVKERENATFVYGFFTRMLYSCLVDADFLDTEAFMKEGRAGRESGEPIGVLCEKLGAYISDWLDNEHLDTVNGRRTQILKNCLKAGKEKRGLFRLTVPTGGGKTIASLAFALEHAKANGMDRIIYVIPYTSIIEQNAEVFRGILGEKNVLENHCNVDYESSEEFKPLQLAAENWDKPVVVTTNVQFFESFFSNKSSKCRKLHNVANSVIIFDEAQMLPNDYLKPCIEVMEELIRYYRSSVVLCTATQPALQTFFSPEIKWKELCPEPEEQFRFFKRTSMKDLGVIAEEILIDRLCKEEQVLCILNTKRLAQRVYHAVKGDKAYHLSTSMYPSHRKQVLNEIRKSLAEGERCVVIATSLVEAGVDLDFRTVYRQAAGIDSMIQAAGRCNREGKRPLKESTAYVFELEGKGKVPGQEQQIAAAKQVMQDQEEFSSQEAVQEYFELLYHYRGDSLDKKDIMNQFCKMKFPFASVSREFKLIEQETRTILIDREERARKIEDEIQRRGLTKALMREAGQYCVTVYENDFQKLYENGMLRGLSGEVKENFFVLRDQEQYKEETGLVSELETGKAMMF